MISAATLLSFERVRRGSRFPFSLLAFRSTAIREVGGEVDDLMDEAGAALPALFGSI